MKSFSASIIIILTALFLLQSCSTTNPRYVSSPSVPNTTFFREKGDMKFAVSGSAAPFSLEKYNYSNNKDYNRNRRSVYGVDGQAAFALSNHFMVAVDGVVRNEEDKYNKDDLDVTNDRSVIGYNRKMINGAIGVYAPLGVSQRAWFNFLAGIGVGRSTSQDNGYIGSSLKTNRYLNANLFKINLHPSFNFFFSEYFRMSVAPRFSFLKYNNIQTNYSHADLKTTQYEALEGHYLPLFEPSIILQSGFPGADWLKLDMGFHFSSDPDIGAYNLNSRNFLFSLGFSIYPYKRRD